MTARRIHLLGASGSGTTTLGRALAERLGCPHFDTDDDLEHHDAWVLSGSLCGWGDLFIPLFDLVIFCAVPSDVRTERLRARERERYGEDAIAPGGRLRAKYEAFLAWAASYEHGPAVERSRAMHDAWLAALPGPVLRLEDTDDVETRLKRVLARLDQD